MSDHLLPDDMYPEDFTTEEFKKADARLGELWSTVPTEPGLYIDGEGEEWVRHKDGSWTDARGDTRGGSAVYILGAFGPWTHAS